MTKTFDTYLFHHGTTIEDANSFEEALGIFSLAMTQMVTDRHRLRGPSNIERIGLDGIWSHVIDKVSRAQNSLETEREIATFRKYDIPLPPLLNVVQDKNESELIDSLGDIVGYVALAVLYYYNLHTLPLEDEDHGIE